MVKKEKVILMTRLAIEEKTDPRYRFITGSFWFDDYASKELWEAFFAISFAYALVVLLGLIAYGDSWTVTYHIADAMELARILLMIWLAVLALGMLVCLLTHVALYRDAYRNVWRNICAICGHSTRKKVSSYEDVSLPSAQIPRICTALLCRL